MRDNAGIIPKPRDFHSRIAIDFSGESWYNTAMKNSATKKQTLCAFAIILSTVLCALLCGCGNKITLGTQCDNIDKLTAEGIDGAIVDRAAIEDILSPFVGLTVTQTDDRAKDTRTPVLIGYANDIKYLEIIVDKQGRVYVVIYDTDGEYAEYCSRPNAVDRAALIETIKKYNAQ